MKIALVQCPGWGRDCPPYTMALLSAILRQENHEVFCFDVNNALYYSSPDEYKKFWDDKDLYTFWSTKDLIDKFLGDSQKMLEFQVEQILNTEARIIGFTVHFSSLLVSLEISRRIKEKDKKRIVVFGGPDCCRQLRGPEVIKYNAVDVVNIGEGDLGILELVRQLEKEGRINFVKGTFIKNNGTIIDCGDAEIVKDLDSLPFPDYSDFRDDISSGLYQQPERLEMLDSRGCITCCHFCSEWQFWKKFRSMSGKRMFEEVCYQIKNFPQVDYFYFIGSLLNGNMRALSEFCDLVIKNNIKIRWLGQAVVRKEMTRDFLKKMRKAGCQWLGYGIESGSQRVIDKINKRFDIKLAEQVLKDTHDAGIQVQANFMFGIPTETEEDFAQTLDFLKRSRENMDSVLASQSFCVIDKDTYLYNHPDDFGITDREHHLFWEAKGGNTYPERFRRYEEFCKLALSLGIPETSGVLKVKPDKWRLLGDYYWYKKDYPCALESFQKAYEFESQEESIKEKIELCKWYLKDTNPETTKTASLEKSQLQTNSEMDGLNETQKKIICALNGLGLIQKLENFILIEKEKMQRKEIVTGYPYWLTVDPSNFCTLKCPFCPTGQGRQARKRALLSLDNFKKIIKVLGPYLIHADFCNWGEPLLNPQVFDMVRIAEEYHIDTKIDTNLNHFDEKTAEAMVLSRLDKVILSIDGITEETYAKYRVGGDFQKVMRNLKILLKKKREFKSRTPYISWQFLVFRHNEHEIEEVKRLGRDLGVDHVGISRAFIGNKEWIPLNEEYSNYKKEEMEDELTSEYFKVPEDAKCNWPWETIVINPNGSVSPCCSVEDEKDDFGNIFSEPFKEIWNNDKYRQARKFIRSKVRPSGINGNICIGCRHLGMINLDILSCHSLFQ